MERLDRASEADARSNLNCSASVNRGYYAAMTNKFTFKLKSLFFLLMVTVLSPFALHAKTIQVNFSELLESPNGDSLENSAWSDLGLNYVFNERNLSLEQGCAYSANLDWLQGTLQLTSDSNIVLDFTTIGQSITALLTLPLELRANGHIEQKFGLKAFGECAEYAEDGFNLSVIGSGQITLGIAINPQFNVAGNTLSISAELVVNTEVAPFVYAVNVEGSLLESLLEDRLRDEINTAMNSPKLEQSLEDIAEKIREAFSLTEDQPLELELPGASPESIQAFIEILKNDVDLPLTEALVRGYLRQLLDIDSTNQTLQSSFASAITCELMNSTAIETNSAPLYQQTATACSQILPTEIISEGTYFSEPQCRQQVYFRPTQLNTFCRNTLEANRVGDGALLAGINPAWTLSPGVKMDIGVVSTKGKKQPFSTHRVYKKIAADRGVCELEMRIYKENPADTDLIPLIALHGGSWQYRSNGILGIEALAAHYTSQGFAVFAPFYRLAAEKSGPTACQNVSAKEIVLDVNDALDWVKEHKKEFGLNAEKIRLTGQSAGAHLAAWLSVNRAAEIERTLLLYPPTDIGDYLEQWLQGNLGANPKGLSIISRFLDTDIHQIDLSNPLIQANSFPKTIAQSPTDYPPMFIIQGGSDQLVPPRQSQRLCNAFSGNSESGPASQIETDHSIQKRQIFNCDQRDSQLHIITEADHTLDVCLFSVFCPAGDQQSQTLASDSLQKGYQWLRTNNSQVKSDSDKRNSENLSEAKNQGSSGGGGGGGGINYWELLFLIIAVTLNPLKMHSKKT